MYYNILFFIIDYYEKIMLQTGIEPVLLSETDLESVTLTTPSLKL